MRSSEGGCEIGHVDSWGARERSMGERNGEGEEEREGVEKEEKEGKWEKERVKEEEKERKDTK